MSSLFIECLFIYDNSCKYKQIMLFYSILFYSILFYSILFCSILFYSILNPAQGKRRDHRLMSSLPSTQLLMIYVRLLVTDPVSVRKIVIVRSLVRHSVPHVSFIFCNITFHPFFFEFSSSLFSFSP